jgi:hypothetical protein
VWSENDVSIEITAVGIRVRQLEVALPDVGDYFRQVPEGEREAALIDVVNVGTRCLELARTGRDLDFVRRAVQALVSQVEAAVEGIPAATRDELLRKIGTSEGQVLEPVQALVEQVSRALTERVRDLRGLMDSSLDPDKESSILGKALGELRNLLDPRRTDSIQGSVASAIDRAMGEDGVLAKSVKAGVAEAMRPLADEVSRLGKEIRGQEARLEALQETIQKGAAYEDEVVVVARAWARHCSAEVQHVGTDNRPGDVLVKVTSKSVAGSDVALVIEARDQGTAAGRKVISGAVAAAMAERGATLGIYVGQIQRIEGALGRITTINRKATDVQGVADEIQKEARLLRYEVREALDSLEAAIREVTEESQPALATVG